MSNKNIFPIAIKFITFNITSHTLKNIIRNIKKKKKRIKVQGIVQSYNSIPTYFPPFSNRKIKIKI